MADPTYLTVSFQHQTPAETKRLLAVFRPYHAGATMNHLLEGTYDVHAWVFRGTASDAEMERFKTLAREAGAIVIVDHSRADAFPALAEKHGEQAILESYGRVGPRPWWN